MLLRAGSLLVVALALPLVLPSCAKSFGESCELNSDCLEGYCFEGECTQDCTDSERDCPKGYLCNRNGQCEFDVGGTTSTATGSSSGEGGASGVGGGASTTSTGNPASTSNTTTSTGSSMSGDAPMLTGCAFDSDCASGLCRAMQVGGTKRCTTSCSALGDCPAGHRCEVGSGESLCVESDIGRGCNDVGQCHFACLTPANYCTSQCASGADCPNGYGCMPVGNPATNVCILVAADCAADTSKCIVPAACDSSPELVVSSCTIACDSAADCPQRAAGLAPWSCDGNGICRRPGDVYGPLPVGTTPAQYACNGLSDRVNVCNDGLHIDFASFSVPTEPNVSCNATSTTDGAPSDACLDSCRMRGGCDFGFACSGLATLDNASAIGLCMPRGSGEVGAACTKNGDCVYGLCEGSVCSRDCSKDGQCPEGFQCKTPSPPELPLEGTASKRCLP
jgi:hypothetical protein